MQSFEAYLIDLIDDNEDSMKRIDKDQGFSHGWFVGRDHVSKHLLDMYRKLNGKEL